MFQLATLQDKTEETKAAEPAASETLSAAAAAPKPPVVVIRRRRRRIVNPEAEAAVQAAVASAVQPADKAEAKPAKKRKTATKTAAAKLPRRGARGPAVRRRLPLKSLTMILIPMMEFLIRKA